MENIFLSEAEIISMTRRTRHRQQAVALIGLGIIYVLRHDGSPLVLREHVRNLLGALHPAPKILAAPADSINVVNERILAFQARKITRRE